MTDKKLNEIVSKIEITKDISGRYILCFMVPGIEITKLVSDDLWTFDCLQIVFEEQNNGEINLKLTDKKNKQDFYNTKKTIDNIIGLKNLKSLANDFPLYIKFGDEHLKEFCQYGNYEIPVMHFSFA